MNPRFLVSKPQFFPAPIPGVITVTVTPICQGRISFQGSFYPAQLADQNSTQELSPGTTVAVLGRLGIILLVGPW